MSFPLVILLIRIIVLVILLVGVIVDYRRDVVREMFIEAQREQIRVLHQVMDDWRKTKKQGER